MKKFYEKVMRLLGLCDYKPSDNHYTNLHTYNDYTNGITIHVMRNRNDEYAIRINDKDGGYRKDIEDSDVVYGYSAGGAYSVFYCLDDKAVYQALNRLKGVLQLEYI